MVEGGLTSVLTRPRPCRLGRSGPRAEQAPPRPLMRSTTQVSTPADSSKRGRRATPIVDVESASEAHGSAGGMRILIIDDHELLAQSMVFIMRSEGLDVAATTGPSLEDVLTVAATFQPTVILLDLDLGTMGSALPLISDLSGLDARVVMVSASTDRCQLAECLEQGAVGVVNKTAPMERLLEAVSDAATTGSAMSPDARHSYMAELRARRSEEASRLAPFDRLTPREQDVLLGLGEGKTATEIAEAGFVSVFTVRGHIRAILTKLGVGSQLAAIARARDAGWLP